MYVTAILKKPALKFILLLLEGLTKTSFGAL